MGEVQPPWEVVMRSQDTNSQGFQKDTAEDVCSYSSKQHLLGIDV